MAHRLRGDYALVAERGLAAMRELERHGLTWFSVATEVIIAMGYSGGIDGAAALAPELCVLGPTGVALTAQINCVAKLAAQFVINGKASRATPLFEWLETAAKRIPASDASAEAPLYSARAWLAVHHGNPVEAARLYALSATGFEVAGDRRSAAAARLNFALFSIESGKIAVAVKVLQEVLLLGERMGLASFAACARQNLGRALAKSGAVEQGRDLELEAAKEYAALKLPRMEGVSRRFYLAEILASLGDLDGAQREVDRAIELVGANPAQLASALSICARVCVLRGEPLDALSAARKVDADPRADRDHL